MNCMQNCVSFIKTNWKHAFVQPPLEDAEAQKVVILKARVRRVSTGATLCLLLVSLMVVSMGIIGGKYLYDQYIRSQMPRFRGFAQIPMGSGEESLNRKDFMQALAGDEYLDDSNIVSNVQPDSDEFDSIIQNYFREDFEIDMAGEKYEKIDVPDFRDGRSGR